MSGLWKRLLSKFQQKRPSEESAAEHFKKCGPFCQHVRLCPDCQNIYGVCDKHRGNADEVFEWLDG